MEALDADSIPWNFNVNTWYTLIPKGDVPSHRVGHTATLLPGKRKIVIVGGATPNELFGEVWIFDLENFDCKLTECAGDFKERYEHCAFTSSCLNSSLWVFAGANMDGNKNDLWELDLEKFTWKLLTQEGTIPPPRTHHANIADVALTVFGGGSKGPDPILDLQVYRLDLCTKMWTVIPTRGRFPMPRHGHVLVSVDGRVFCHGGMAGDELLNDLHVLDSRGLWTIWNDSVIRPCPRAAHGAVYFEGFLYLFGGLSKEGALNDLWKLNTSSFIWEQVTVHEPSPPARLDFAMTLMHLPRHFVDDESAQDNDTIPCILLHGGMNESGDLFCDFHILRLH